MAWGVNQVNGTFGYQIVLSHPFQWVKMTKSANPYGDISQESGGFCLRVPPSWDILGWTRKQNPIHFCDISSWESVYFGTFSPIGRVWNNNAVPQSAIYLMFTLITQIAWLTGIGSNIFSNWPKAIMVIFALPYRAQNLAKPVFIESYRVTDYGNINFILFRAPELEQPNI